MTLSGLPSRETTAGEIDNALFMLALEGVTRYALNSAVKAISQGGLRHAFLPSPPELRLQCDKAMEWHERERERIRRRQRENEDYHRQKTEWRPPTDEEKARAAAVYADFCKGYEKASAEDTLKLDPELVAQIPDNPKALIHQRRGKSTA